MTFKGIGAKGKNLLILRVVKVTVRLGLRYVRRRKPRLQHRLGGGDFGSSTGEGIFDV